VSFAGPLRKVAEVQSPYGRKGRLTPVARALPGALAVAETDSGLVLVSAYGAFDEGYTVTTVHRLLSDLTPLLDSPLGKRVVLAGDLNLSTQIRPPHRVRHRNALERFATLGLVDCFQLARVGGEPLAGCPCEDEPCRHVRTQRHPRSRVPWQTDYIFVSQALARRVRGCSALDGARPDPWKLSDHCPLVLELED
jgi:exonuclease III